MRPIKLIKDQLGIPSGWCCILMVGSISIGTSIASAQTNASVRPVEGNQGRASSVEDIEPREIRAAYAAEIAHLSELRARISEAYSGSAGPAARGIQADDSLQADIAVQALEAEAQLLESTIVDALVEAEMADIEQGVRERLVSHVDDPATRAELKAWRLNVRIQVERAIREELNRLTK